MSGDLRGVSPVVSVVLMVAVTVILAATVGSFVLNQAPDTSQTQSSAVRITEQSDGVHVLAVSLETPVEIRYNGTTVYRFNETDTGESYVVPQVTNGGTVSVVSVPESGSATVLSTYTVTLPHSVNDGLVAYYPLDMLSHGVAVDGVGPHTGKIYGNITSVDGISNGAAKFPDSAYIDVNETVPDPTSSGVSGSFSVSFWAKPKSGTGKNPIVEWSQGGGWDTHIWQYDSETDFFLNPTTGRAYEATGSMQLDELAFYTVVFDSAENESRLYVNGTLVASHSDTKTPDTNSDRVYLGWRDGDNRYFVGILDEVRIYNRPLNASEVNTLYEQGSDET